MRRRNVTAIRILAVALAAAGAGCEDSFSTPERSETSARQAVSPEDDPVNRTVSASKPETSLVVVLEITDTEIVMLNAQIARAASRSVTPSNDQAFVTVIALDAAGREVGRAAAPDRRSKVLEGHGVVELPSQQAILSIPLTGMPVTLKITGQQLDRQPDPVSVTDVMKQFCGNYPSNPLCRPPVPGAPGTPIVISSHPGQ